MLKAVRLLSILASAALLVSCAGGNPFPPVTIDFGQLTPDAPRAVSLPLDEKIGQLFVVPANGVYASEESKDFRTLRHHVVDNHVGGVILFRSNVYGAAVLVGKLQELARVPLLVSADLEAGLGMRFEDVTYGPWAMAIAAAGDPALAERSALATAREARAIGIAQVFAPVADVNVNPDNPVINVRSFGEDPADVARYVEATVRGLQSGNVLATLKHFPGHGDTAVDSHRSLAILPLDKARLESVELVPFRAGIKAGAESVMVAHVSIPSLDNTPVPVLPNPPKPVDAIGENVEVETKGTMPASLSEPVVTGILRKELGFSGLVVTDAIRMGGITSHFTAGEAAVRAILAGTDQVLLSADTDAAIAAVREAVKSGRIAVRRLDESVTRILDCKKRLNLYEKRIPFVGGLAKVVDTPPVQALEAEIARRSLTLVREQPGVLPLEKGAKLLSLVVADEATKNGPAGPLGAEVKARVSSARTVTLDPRSTPEETRAAVEGAKDADVVLVSLFVRTRSGLGTIAVPEAGRTAILQLLALGRPVVVVSFGSPYLLRDFPDLKTYLCAWGGQDIAQVAAVQALFGESAIGGKLPITILGLAKRGDGITKAAVAPPVTSATASAKPTPSSPSKKSSSSGTPPPPRAFVGATLVDGTGAAPVPDAVVLVRAGRIDCAGPRASCRVPEGVDVEDVKGTWITPGLIDAHVHFSQTGWADGRPDALDVRAKYPYEKTEADLKAHPERFFRSYVCSGVTSVFDVGGYPWTLALPRRAENDTFAPRVAAAGPLLSTLDHWLNLPAERQFIHLKDAGSARTGVAYLKTQGSAAVKLWYIVRPDLPIETTTPAVLAAGEEAARNGLRLIAHATSLAEAKVALRAGAKLLVHSVWYQPVDDEFLELAKRNRTIYCPTLTVADGYVRMFEAAVARKAPDIDDPNGCVDPGTRAKVAETATVEAPNLEAGVARGARNAESRKVASANLMRVRGAGIPIAMGTDAGNPLTLHGPSVYAEMEAMQAAGMTPTEVLVASTKGGSLALGRDRELGTVEKGKLADLLILGADPTADIVNVRKVKAVVRGGVLRSIDELRAAVAADGK